jgi:hypothetical protein
MKIQGKMIPPKANNISITKYKHSDSEKVKMPSKEFNNLLLEVVSQ